MTVNMFYKLSNFPHYSSVDKFRAHLRKRLRITLNDLISIRGPKNESGHRLTRTLLLWVRNEGSVTKLHWVFKDTAFLWEDNQLVLEEATIGEIKRLTSAARQKAVALAKRLNEYRQAPLRQLEKMARLCPPEILDETLQTALDTYANGGLRTLDGRRKRTLGGVYFYLVMLKIEPRLRGYIYAIRDIERKPAEGVPPLYPSFTFDKRIHIFKTLTLDANMGEVKYLKITLAGRPGKIEIRRDVVLTVMNYTINEKTPFPKGVPRPPSLSTRYLVYIGIKQWRKVEQAIQDPEDLLIVDGVLMYDPELPGLAVFTLTATTKFMKWAQREADHAREKAEAQARKQAFIASLLGTGAGAMPTPEPPPAAPPVVKAPPPQPQPLPAALTFLPPVTPPEDSAPQGVNAQRLAQLAQMETEARRNLDVIKALPPEEQVGFAQALNKLQRIKAEIRLLQSAKP
jgi:hypothetical protein